MSVESRQQKLADSLKLAFRTYDAGQRSVGMRLTRIAISKIETAEERRSVHLLVEVAARNSAIWPHYYSIMFQGGHTNG